MAAVTTLHTASWGINPEHRNLAAITGVVTGWDETAENVSADEQNEVGSNIGKTVYDKRYNVNCTVQVAANVKPPAAGVKITVSAGTGATTTYYVRSAHIAESNAAYRRISLTLEGSLYSGQTGFLNGADNVPITT